MEKLLLPTLKTQVKLLLTFKSSYFGLLLLVMLLFVKININHDQKKTGAYANAIEFSLAHQKTR